MKVLLVGHSYMTDIAQKKLEELGKKVDLYLLTPKKWRHTLGLYEFKKRGKGFKPIVKSVRFSGNNSLYTFPGFSDIVKKVEPDIIHVEEEPWSRVALQAAKIGKKLIVFTWENIYKNLNFPFSKIEKNVLKNVSCVIAGNKEAGKIIKKKGYEGRIKIIPQFGIDTDFFYKSGRKKKGFTIGFVGRLVKEKGLLVLMDAAKKIKGNFRLLFVGDGNLKNSLNRIAKRDKIKIRIIGTVPHSKVRDYLNKMDCLVLPSLTTKKWKEQFGQVLAEAMACEVPVIGSDSGAIPEVVGNSGLVFREGDSSELAKKIKYLMNNSKARTSLGKKGRMRVLRNYTNRKIADETYKIYKALVKR